MQQFDTRSILYALSLLIFTGMATTTPASDDSLAWPGITSQTRPWTYWWWMGSAVDRTNLTRELQRYHDAGLGGVHIIPIYGAKGWESNYISYLGPKWMEMLGYTVSEAHRLGLGVDMTTGTGWCFGGPDVSDRDANASVVVKTFDLATGERLKEKFKRDEIQALVAFSPDGRSVELTDKISATGEVDWTAPGGFWRVYAISQKPSGQKVKRAAPGGEGWMLNPFYLPAMSNYLCRFSDVFAGYNGPKPRAQYQDSYEYKSDWAPDFFTQFEKRRGYKLQTELPALFGTNTDDHAARVKSDYRETASDLMIEESMPLWTARSHEHGFITRYQAHGAPGNLLDLYATADIPETEMNRTNRNPLVSKFASSAAHVTGKPLVSAETGTWLAEHFTVTLGEMKSLVDELFLSGVNHAFYHGTCYSPDDAGWPGWVFYASTEMNPRNPIWRDAPALNDYVARCQSILQSGKPDNDILLYWPIYDYWSTPTNHLLPLKIESQQVWFENQPIGKTAHELWNCGYAFDYVSDRQLRGAKVADGKIQMPGGNYSVIVVPECKFMPLETFKRLLALADKGAAVVFEEKLPLDVSGASNSERTKFRDKLREIKYGVTALNVPFATTGYGSVMIATSSNMWRSHIGAKGETMVSRGLSYVRRSFDGGWHYFIANRSGTNSDGWVTLGRSAKSVVILDPMTGNSGLAASRQSAGNLTEVHLQLAAGQSVILRAFADKKVEDPAWDCWQTNGQPVDINGSWNVKFIQGGPTLPADFQTTKLASWTTFPDTNTQAFAGTAKYTLEFNLQVAPDTLKRELQPFALSLGDVRQSARVKLNGKNYGTLITPPFCVLVDNLKPKGNVLEIEVASVAANRIRDLDRRGVPWKTFHDINFVNLDYKPFNASGWPLTDCGLLGPVTLTAVAPAQIR
ncbi:MAG: glycosyl hydrolase [Verrucomicrobiota bacterium]